MKAIGVIPARGGSKGIERKNVRLLLGKPLIAYITKTALAAQTLSEVYVSTDDKQIAQIATDLGANVILHPTHLSHDSAPTFGVIQYACELLRHRNIEFDALVTMRATSPLCLPRDIDEAVAALSKHPNVDSVISVVQSSIHPYRILRINSWGELERSSESPEFRHPVQRQTLDPVFVRNGAVYASRVETIDAGGLWGSHSLPYLMPAERSVNINQEIDWVLAEAMLKQRLVRGSA